MKHFFQCTILGTKLKFHDMGQQMSKFVLVPNLNGLTADVLSDVLMYCFLSYAVVMLFYLQEAV